ncbi:hypothetical protein Tco_0459267 [Tanacetum coccineum]
MCTMPIIEENFLSDLDLLEQHLTKDILSRTDCTTTLTNLRTKFENAFNSEFEERMRKYTRYNAQSFNDAMICTIDSIRKYMLEIILHQQRTLHFLNSKPQDVHAIKYKMSKAKERCMAYFRSLHSHLQVLSKDDLKGTRIEHGFKRAFMSLFGQDVDTFTRTMLLNVDQLQKQLDKDEFQEDGSMTAFWVVNNQFQKFIDSKFTLDYDSQMTDTYFVEYTGIEVQHFRDTLLQHLGNVKKSVAERTRHKRQYERRVNKRQMQTQERQTNRWQDDNNRSGNDTDADDADIRPIYDEIQWREVTNYFDCGCNIFAIGQQHTEQPEIIYEGRVDQYPVTCQVKSPMLDSSPDNQTTEYSKQSLESVETDELKISGPWSIYWLPTGKIFTPSTTKVDSEPPNGSNADITNQYESAQTLDVSAGTSNLSAGTSFNPKKEELRPRTTVSTEVHQAAETVTTSNELDLLFGPLFDEYFNGENQVVLKSSAVTTTDASNKRQQQPDSTSSTSTLATTVTANGNFDL